MKTRYRSFFAWLVRSPGVELYSWNYGGPQYSMGDMEKDVAWGDPRVPWWSSIQDGDERDKALRDNQSTPMMDLQAGWPLATLRGRLTPATLQASHEKFQCREGMLRFRDSTSRIWTGTSMSLSGHLFPLIPVWSGMVVNTGAYAITWAGVLMGIPAWKTQRRARRGRCVRCGYDLRGLGVGAGCPECGANTPLQPADRRLTPLGSD